MFTLKLFKRMPFIPAENKDGPSVPAHKITKIVAVHHVQVQEIGLLGHALEVFAFDGPEPSTYKTFYVGEPEEGMDAYGKPLHLDNDDWSWWGWGLLENGDGNTTQHFRPASFG